MREALGKEGLNGDLQFAYVLWQCVLAREKMDMPREPTAVMVSVCMYVCMYVCIHICMCMYVFVYMYVCGDFWCV